MTTTGSGVGGNIGGPMIPLQRDLEATAWTEVNKAALGIVRDSIAQSIVFSEMSPRYAFGYLGGFGYNAAATHANLPRPLEIMRMSQEYALASASSWQDYYNQLVGKLPQDLVGRFLQEKNKPFGQRDQSFAAADGLFTVTAKILNQLQNIAEAKQTSTHTVMNLMLPFTALSGSISQGRGIMQATQTFLETTGPNNPYFDMISNNAAQIQMSLQLLQQISAGAQRSSANGVPGQLSDETRSIAASTAKLLTSLNTQMDSVDSGPDLKIIQAFTYAIGLTAIALALPTTAAGGLYIGLNAAMIGIDAGNDNPAGVIGPDLAGLNAVISNSIIPGILPGNQLAGRAFLATTVQASFLTFIALSSLAAREGFGAQLDATIQDTDNALFFGLQSAVQIAVNSGVIQSFYEELIATSGGDAKAQQLGGSSLALLAHLLMIASGTSGNAQLAARLVEEVAPALSQGIAAGDALGESIDESQSGAVALKQASIALNNRNYDDFLEVVNSWADASGFSMKGLQENFMSINKTVDLLIAAAVAAGDNEQLSSAVNVV